MNVCIPNQVAVLVDTAETGEIIISQFQDNGLPQSEISLWPSSLPLLISALQERLPAPPINEATVEWAREQQTGSWQSKAVLFNLAIDAGADGRVNIDKARIAQETQLSASVVARALARLQELGLLKGEFLQKQAVRS